MASLSEIYLKKSTLETILKALNARQGKEGEGVKLTVSLSDQPNNYGQNVSVYVAQTKEQREAKTPLFYVGNGRTFWTKGETPVAQREEPKQEPKPVTPGNDETDLPFN